MCVLQTQVEGNERLKSYICIYEGRASHTGDIRVLGRIPLEAETVLGTTNTSSGQQFC